MTDQVKTQSTKFTPPAPLKTAVLFLVFNRPDTTAQVFEAIRKAKPPRLYIAADGPRPAREGEAEKVAKVREIATSIDWPCEVKTLFRDKNFGCKHAVSSAITWFFENEEEGIVLEDDCLPSQSFFWFCETLLDQYRDDDRIFIVSGYNKQQRWSVGKCDYFYSNFGGIWGWASWRRAWHHYDSEMRDLERLAADGYFEKLMGKTLGRLRKQQLLMAEKKISEGKMNTWDYPWAFSRHIKKGMACVPTVSLISNIGFGADATHTNSSDLDLVKHQEIGFPIRFNSNMSADADYDLKFVRPHTIRQRLLRRLKRIFDKLWN